MDPQDRIPKTIGRCSKEMDRQIIMPSLKKKWDDLLKQSVALATILVMIFCAMGLLLVVGAAVIITKIIWFIK